MADLTRKDLLAGLPAHDTTGPQVLPLCSPPFPRAFCSWWQGAGEIKASTGSFPRVCLERVAHE